MSGGSISDIYPNPASNFVSIDYELTPQVKTAQIRIVNLLGTLVTEAEIERNVNRYFAAKKWHLFLFAAY